MNLIGELERLEYSGAINDLHETFCRPILVYKTPLETIISTDVNFNYYYNGPDGQGSEDYVEYTPVSGTVCARILYDKSLDSLKEVKGRMGQNFKVDADGGLVRIKVRDEDYDTYFTNLKDVQFDGYQFENWQTPRPHGLFDPNFRTLFLKIKN